MGWILFITTTPGLPISFCTWLLYLAIMRARKGIYEAFSSSGNIPGCFQTHVSYSENSYEILMDSHMALGQLQEKLFVTSKETFIAHFIAYYSENILDSAISQPRIDMTGFHY